ncbi:MAG: bacillithiol system redox-active protein YtxJ [Blastocatellia bacterium]|nr:bacillithiol system redox-active protein YtxJ [Blastocatellia bacterium]
MANLNELTSIDAFEQVIASSSNRVQLLFKHSNACPISSDAFQQLKKHLSSDASPNVDYWLVTVQLNRDVSNRAAEQLGVVHESPQAIVIKDGKAVDHTSHFKITTDWLASAVS